MCICEKVETALESKRAYNSGAISRAFRALCHHMFKWGGYKYIHSNLWAGAGPTENSTIGCQLDQLMH